MIPNYVPTVACFVEETDEGTRWDFYPVVAWEDDGTALVVVTGERRCIPVSDNLPFPGTCVTLMRVPSWDYDERTLKSPYS